MSPLKRFWNFLKGVFSAWVFELEAENPEIVYDNVIETQISVYHQLQGKTGAVKRREMKLAQDRTETEAKLREVTESLNAAASMDEKDVDFGAAAEAMRIQEQLTTKLNGLNDEYAQALADTKDIKEALMQVESNINTLKSEKDTKIGQYRSAQSRIDIMNMDKGLSLEETKKSLDAVRGRIDNVIATAKVTQEMKDESLESRVRQFQQITEGKSAEQKFRQLREAAQANAKQLNAAPALDQVIQSNTAKTAVNA